MASHKWQRVVSALAAMSLMVGSIAPALAASPQAPSTSAVATRQLAGDQPHKPDQANWVAPGFQSAESLRQAEIDRKLSALTALEADVEQSAATGVYIVQFEGEPASLYVGDVPGLAATSPLVTGAHKMSVYDPAVMAYRSYLAEKRNQALSAIEAVVGHKLEVLYTYDLAYHGAAIKLTPEQALAVAALPGVRFIQPEQIYQLHTDVGPQFMNADDIWSGAATGMPTKGEGIVVGIIDTGINMDHPSFADIGGDGYDHTNPLGSGNYIGWCNPGYPVLVVCNDKLIGAWGYASNTNTPEDADGHGSHTAGTTAGNVIISATVDGSGAAITRTISGVAPHANIIAYAACCAGSALQAAIEQIITDSVDVVNYSIGPTAGESNPYTDSNMQGFLGATAAGIFVSVSAGNSGSGASTVGNTAPWVQITAASEHNRSIANSLINMNGTNGAPPANIQGKGFTGGLGPRQIVYAGAAPYNNALCGPFPAGTFTGQIVVCDRGTYGRVEKSTNVMNAGGGGFVLVNTASSAASLSGDAFSVPGTFISYADGQVLKTWLAGGGVYTASISGYSVNINSPFADAMAGFSSRGPSIFVPDTIVPSLSAPGVDILAAYADGEVPTDPEFIMISGTSMSSPHAAGAAALMRALYPTWTPAQIKSALMMAGTTNMRKENNTTAATPFDRGSGRILVDGAANVGFVLNETAARFAAANPSTGGNPAILNLASVAQDACFGACTWTRVIKSVWPDVVTYTTSFSSASLLNVAVSPATIVLNPGEVATITISADASAITTTDVWNTGDLYFWPTVAQTGATGVMTYTATPTVNIPDNTVQGVTSTLAITDSYTINDLNLVLSATHSWVGDLIFTVTSPSNLRITPFDRPGAPVSSTAGCSSNNIPNITLDDDPGGAPGTPVETSCTTVTTAEAYLPNGSYTPNNPLAGFDGLSTNGTWSLQVSDRAGVDTGVLQQWALVVDYEAPTPVPALAHFPVAVRVPAATLDANVYLATPRDSGGLTIHGQVGSPYATTSATVYGIGMPNSTVGAASGFDDQDWDTNPLDPAFGWFLYDTTIPTNVGRLRVATSGSNVADLDLAVLVDLNQNGTFEWPGERVAQSAGGSAVEVIDLLNLQAYAGYGIMAAVYNWSGEANATFNLDWWIARPTVGDLSLINLPTTLGAGEMFTPTLRFSRPLEAGETYYGVVNFGDGMTEDAIGSTTFTIQRTANEVEKSVWPTTANIGDVVTYTIVLKNQDSVTRTFAVTDVLPANLTYVPGSLTGAGATMSGTDTILINQTIAAQVQSYNYAVVDSINDPTILNDHPFGGFTDFAVFGAPGPRGDNLAFAFNAIGCAMLTFYNDPAVTGTNAGALGYNTNGGVFPRSSTTSAVLNAGPHTAPLPTAALPNGFIAGFAGDLSITNTVNITDAGRIAVSGGACGTTYLFGLQLNLHKKSDDSQKVKAQYIYDQAQPGIHWMAFGGVSSSFSTSGGQSGVEDFTGANATAYTGPITNNLVLKYYRPLQSAPPITVTFQATVTGPAPTLGWVVNSANYTVNVPDTTDMDADATLNLANYPQVTFVYHDAEDVVWSGEGVLLAGSLNGWPAPGWATDGDLYGDVFSITVPITPGSYDYKYQVYDNGAVAWDMLNTNNRNYVVTSSATQTVNDYRNVVPGWQNLESPVTMTVWVNQPTSNIYGQLYIMNVTNGSGPGRGLKAEVGYGTGTNFNTWMWSPMTFDSQVGNNDKYMGNLGAIGMAGVYSYATRYNGNWGVGNPNSAWTYGDTDGGPFEFNKAGALTVWMRLFGPIIYKPSTSLTDGAEVAP